MTSPTFPSPKTAHRKADIATHVVGLAMVLGAGGLLLSKAVSGGETKIIVAVAIYALSTLVSNAASWMYHFAPLHDKRVLLRRIDHAAIYPSISGTFTPFFVQANTTWTLTLLWVCWGLTALAIWKKLTDTHVKSKWSTASYLALGAIGLSALPDLTDVPVEAVWCIIAGAVCYVIGTGFYARKSMPYRYAIWHNWVNFGGIFMAAAVWMALF